MDSYLVSLNVSMGLFIGLALVLILYSCFTNKIPEPTAVLIMIFLVAAFIFGTVGIQKGRSINREFESQKRLIQE